MNLEEAAEIVALTVECPHPTGSPEAVQWWRDEWADAIKRGDVEPRAEDAIPQELPAFPVDVLPERMRVAVRSIAANKRVPVDMPALLALVCVAIVAAPRVTIYRGRDWWEPLVEWVLIIAESGEGKSPAVSVLADVLHDVQRSINKRHTAKVKAAQQEIRGQIEALTRPVKGISTVEQKRKSDEVKALNERIEELGGQQAPQLLIGGSSTLEAIEKRMAGTEGGSAAVLDDEGGAFGIISGVYNDGVPTGLDTILKGYSGTRVPANERISRTAEGISRAVLCYGITVQPVVLAESFRSPALRARGFHARWCYATPEPVVGRRPVDPPDLDYQAVDDFTEALNRIAAMPVIDADNQRRRDWPTLSLSREARKLHLELQAEVEPRLDPDTGDLAFVGDWANKYVGRVLRHAGLLHLAAGYEIGDAVSEETMRSAIMIGEWALDHASDVYRRAPKPKRGRKDDDDAGSMTGVNRVRRWIAKNKKVAFSTRDAHTGVRNQKWCGCVDDLEKALTTLRGEGLLRTVPRQGKDGRELDPWWVAHPDLVYGA